MMFVTLFPSSQVQHFLWMKTESKVFAARDFLVGAESVEVYHMAWEIREPVLPTDSFPVDE